MIVYFSKVSLISGMLNIPYFIWVIFADILNLYICKLNSD
jgi:tryptophan-rich sensory protein